VPVAIRAFNPNDKAFGMLPDVNEVEVALKTAKVVKRPAAKKAPAKKSAAKK